MATKSSQVDAPERYALLRGIEKLSRAVKVAFGPSGQNIILDKFGSPFISRDGVTIAKELELEDPYENAGAQFMRQIASSTGQMAGGGTTTATVLAESIYKEGLRNVTAGANPISLQSGINKAVDAIVEELKKISRKVSDRAAIAQVATISANWNERIGEIIADAMDKVGKDGTITVGEAKSIETSLDMVEGMQFDKGYVSPYFVTNAEAMEAVLDDPYILLYHKKISSLKDILPLLEKVAKTGHSLLVIAEDVEGEALATLVVNKMRGTLQVCAVKAPGFGDRRTDMIKDLAILTGARHISEDLELKLENLRIEDLGSAKRVIVDKENTMIIEGSGKNVDIESRVAQIRREIEKTKSDYLRGRLQERCAKLAGGVAVISIGAANQTELKEKRARVEGALQATRAAVEEGIVLGGGVAFLRAQQVLDNLKNLEGDEKVGVAIVRRAIEEPCRQLANNAGAAGSLIVQTVKEHKGNIGYDIRSGEYVDLFAAGIVDSTKATRSALQNAASISNLLLQTDVAAPDFPRVNLPSDISFGPPDVRGITDLPAAIKVGSSETFDSANGGGGPPSQPPTPHVPKVTDPGGPPIRYLVARTDERVTVNVPFTVTVRISTENIPAGPGRGGAPIRDVVGKLKIIIYAPGFSCNDGTQREIDVPPTGNSSWAPFELVAVRNGVQTVEVLAFKNSAQVGNVTISISVGSTEPGQHAAQSEINMREPEEGEYTLEVTFDDDLKRYQFQLISDTREPWPVMFSPKFLGRNETVYAQIISRLDTEARNLNQSPENVQRRWLRGMGSRLYKSFVPPELKEAIWTNRNRIKYLNIYSVTDAMPWELLYISNPAGTGGERQFLADTATIVRWKYDYGFLPGRVFSKKNPYFVLPEESPSTAQQEVELARKKLGAASQNNVIDQLEALLELLDEGRFSLLHFASHNVNKPDPKGGLYVPFGKMKFDPMLMDDLPKKHFSNNRPLVFMNSCTSGGKAPLYTEMAGWADSFLEVGCGAFIGALWEIRDQSAHEFSAVFYDEVASGKNLGEAMRAGRSELKTSDPTYLAYTLYGNPLAKLL